MLTWRDAEEEVELRWLEAMWESETPPDALQPLEVVEIQALPLRQRLALVLVRAGLHLDPCAITVLDREAS